MGVLVFSTKVWSLGQSMFGLMAVQYDNNVMHFSSKYEGSFGGTVVGVSMTACRRSFVVHFE